MRLRVARALMIMAVAFASQSARAWNLVTQITPESIDQQPFSVDVRDNQER